MLRVKTSKPSRYYRSGTERLLWESEAEFALYEQYSKLPELTGCERTIAQMISDTWSESELTLLAERNDWVGRASSYDKFWKPKAAASVAGRIETAEIAGSELSSLAFNLLQVRLATEPHRVKTSELIAIAKLAPMINRSESTVIKD